MFLLEPTATRLARMTHCVRVSLELLMFHLPLCKHPTFVNAIAPGAAKAWVCLGFSCLSVKQPKPKAEGPESINFAHAAVSITH